MRIDEARARKQALLSGGLTGSAPGTVRSLEVASPTFVGIVPSGDPDGFRLAVRLTQVAEDSEELLATIRGVAGDDVDVRVVGPIRALSQEPVPGGQAAPVEPGSEGPPQEFVPPTPEQLQKRVRPLVRGLSVAHQDVTAGTIGAFVRLPDSEATHVLSNNHVLGDSDRGQPGDNVLQPGPYDGGTADDRVGELLVAVRLDPDQPNLVDCALAVLDAEVEVDPAAHDGPIDGVLEPAEVTGNVAKIGRTTGYTLGRITAVEVDGVPVGYDTGVFTFDNQIEIEGLEGEFSAGGDSGSLIYTEDGRHGVGLLFAGSTSGGSSGEGVTYANPISAVLSALGATLL